MLLGSYSSSEDGSDREYRVELESSEEESSDSLSKKLRRIEKKRKKKKKKKKKGLLLEWEEEDEIRVLKQLYEFSGNNASYSKAFYEHAKRRLRNGQQVSMNEMSSKIRGFKEEYLENEWRRINNELKFSGPHQWQVFLLSKRIWGADNHHLARERNNNKDLKGFMEFLQEMEIDVNCLMPSCLEFLKKEWQVQLLMYIELLSNKSNFDAKLRELIMFPNSEDHPNTQPFQTI